MALLNKLFFPSSSSSTAAPSIPSAVNSSAAATTCNTQTNVSLSRSSSLASILSSSVNNNNTNNNSGCGGVGSTSIQQKTNTTKQYGNNNRKATANQSTHSKNYLSHFPFDGSQVRILVYRECDTRGRRLLFDSNALEKVYHKEKNGNNNSSSSSNKHIGSKSTSSIGVGGGGGGGGSHATNQLSSLNNNHHNKESSSLLSDRLSAASSANNSNKGAHSNGGYIDVCDEYGYKHNRPNSTDISSIGEMVFGALAMSFRGPSLKVHWLQPPSRLLCSQVFLTPLRPNNNGHSPYSTFSTNSLATPRTSICSEHGSIDGLSMSSFSLPYSMGMGRNQSLTPSDLSTSVSSPLDVPSIDQQSIMTNTDSSNADRFSSTYSTGTDSGYSAISRGAGTASSSDQWSAASYQYSTRSSLGSVMSEQSSDRVRKCSIDSNIYPGSSCSGSTNAMAISSDGSLQRRISRNIVTSFENENSMNDLIGFVTDNYANIMMSNSSAPTAGGSEGLNLGVNYPRPNCSYTTNESRSNPEMGRRREMAPNQMKAASRRARLGLAVCITMSESFEEEMELFCSEHIALFESMLSRLRASTERAYIHHNNFLQIMYQIWQDTQQWFVDLFTAPRIKCPVWLSITTSGSKYSKNVAERFIKELCWLLSFADTKDTNFFISTMLTAILTHHLGWVPTVSPFSSSSSTAAVEQRAKLLQVSQKHPYNALWAQMGDLFGAIGLPPKLARTVIYGTEKLSVERLLNVLTYFIRCGEVRRSAKKEDYNRDMVNNIVAQNKNETFKKSPLYGGAGKRLGNEAARNSGVLGNNCGIGAGGIKSGLTRSQTCKQNLSLHDIGGDDDTFCERDEEYDEDETDAAIRTYKKNEIPTVLAFRDSRFVQQELRIGNYLMDTGIERNSVAQYQKAKQRELVQNKNEGRIRLTLTTPDNVELIVEDPSNCNAAEEEQVEGVLEAIEIETLPTEKLKDKPATTSGRAEHRKKRPFFWSMAAAEVKEGLSLKELNKLQQCGTEVAPSSMTTTKDKDGKVRNPATQHLSLSALITQNSIGKSDCPMTWGVEPIKENVSHEEQIHFDISHKHIEREHGIGRNKEEGGGGGVVFVLGDNEPLVNIKRSTEDLCGDTIDSKGVTTSSLSSANDQQKSEHMLCPLHQRLHNPLSDASNTTNTTAATQQLKKHSGVKFNFEQYPQIVTNYMKSKNLLMTNYDLLMDKCSKLEAAQNNSPDSSSQRQQQQLQQQIIDANLTTTFPPQSKQTNATTTTSTPNCIVCQGLLNAYQTPSNATELEFESDELHCFVNNKAKPASPTTPALTTVSSQASVQTLISSNDQGGGGDHPQHATDVEMRELPTPTAETPKKTFFSSNQKKCSSQRGSMSSVAAKCAAANEAMHLLQMPIPAVKDIPQDDELSGDMKLPVGFIPSLFLNVNDHYVPDMVLQGTYASPSKWEINLREDLALAAHSASLISLPAENIAIIADMEKWDVKLISSQSQHFPYAGGQSAPVGMSQLVSSMLETVQIMNSAGISAYECLSFMESKLQEIYLHSETLAAFLLETDFCSLSAVTTALNLSENDVPLLLSIASIHTPQISKKCGISFR